MRLSDTNLQIETGLSVLASGSHSMGRDRNKGCDFGKDQKIGCAEAIKNLNLNCNFSNLSVSVCNVA